MNLFTRDNLNGLMEEREGPCISIFMPAHRTSAGTQQDKIRFKNLLKEAEAKLAAMAQEGLDPQEFLGPANRLLEENSFWQHQIEGLAVFVSPEVFENFRVPISFLELVVAADRFHLKPLLPLLSHNGKFYILALSQNEVHLYRCARDQVKELKSESIPSNIREALKYHDREKQLQFHTGTPEAGGRSGRRAAMFHGHGAGTDDTKDRIISFFRRIDSGIQEVLSEENAPLVLAGVDFLLALYRKANSYTGLYEEGITGNPEGFNAKELYEQAWKIVEPHFQEVVNAAAARYRQFAGTSRASDDLRVIIPASHHGRVELLFVAVDIQTWGVFDPLTDSVTMHERWEPGDEDLLNLAALQTMRNGGTVYAAELDEIPDNAYSAALFRY
jgi:hypothetical protein